MNRETPFNPGERVRMVSQDDPNPVLAGTTGTVQRLFDLGDGRWQITVKWDNGRALRVVSPPDVIERIAITA
jgi:hypothetical protein